MPGVRGLRTATRVDFAAVSADQLDEAGAEVGLLALADAPNREQRCVVTGRDAGQVSQRGIAEDHEGGDRALIGDGAAQLAQRLEEAAVDALPGVIGARCQPRLAPDSGACSCDFNVARQQLAALRRNR